MVGNIFPFEKVMYQGCYQQAWPLQLDMQLTLLVPFVAIAFKKSAIVGLVVCQALIALNIMINMGYAYIYGLKIGLLHKNNFHILETVVMKPWTKLQNVGFGCIAAYLYWQLVLYRRCYRDCHKKEFFPTIHWAHKSKRFGKITHAVATIILVTTMFYPM
jgi:peptidoglycan/LPS O-acetylase OafA/YrhL